MSRLRPGADAGRVVAALGPTNTGKTHRALRRMLEHPTGMIGLPLRLLAREIYDRVTGIVGEAAVALVTGEEKRIPKRPAYWVCTTEAMPLDRTVDFLAVDEIQLAAHRDRGHVFTQRLLSARGRQETWFLGADTMGRVIETLVPTAERLRFRRLSRLRYAEPRSLRSLPPRSAVVAFSAEQVYELAERLRRLQGGVAVVLGALSPRTRNAQVAMYQAGEVDHLVATDAIGMGLNLDIDHVAFAGLRKFDGRESRFLSTEELAQIAGRAGRHVNDGTFGTLKDAGELAFPVIEAIEGHRFRPVERLVWRNDDLDFGSVEALLDSLRAPPGHPALSRVEHADDFEALSELARDPAVRARLGDPAAVALLWEVCQIPDFRKLLLHQHARLLREIFLQLTGRPEGRLDPAWLDRQIRRVDSLSGGIDALTARLSAVRTWTYVSHRAGWLDDPTHWQGRTRALEDALGDALHERLVERFVERAGGAGARTGRRPRRRGPPKAAGVAGQTEARARDAAGQRKRRGPTDPALDGPTGTGGRGDDASLDPHGPFAALRHLVTPTAGGPGAAQTPSGAPKPPGAETRPTPDDTPGAAPRPAAEGSPATRAVPLGPPDDDQPRPELPGDDLARFVHRAVEATHEALPVTRDGVVRFEGVPVGRLVASDDLLAPGVALLDADDLTAGERRRLERRLVALGRDLVVEASGGARLDALGLRSAAARGFAYGLARGLGIAPRDELDPQWDAMDAADRARLEDGGGIVRGARTFHVRDALRHRALDRRAVLVAVAAGLRPPPGVPEEPVLDAGAVPDGPGWARRFGYERVAGLLLRVDLLEGIAAELAAAPQPEAAPGGRSTLLDGLDLPSKSRRQLATRLGPERAAASPGPSRRGRRRGRRRRRGGGRRGGGPRPEEPASRPRSSGDAPSKG
jgi:hypothetical protein